ncbi:tyrosine-type recombinase/integrase [Tumebacillus flagellatus]|uniref:Integrase n=1 Tax=Tumebacillus flagellatus TaxID=1157490 RepID=A0A074LIH7_9BACL|nr:tyrosine-type recombinase/integrase [Tumebacillus flagellatus]KEO82011.1 integrase [Tumebacillus flagellatus]
MYRATASKRKGTRLNTSLSNQRKQIEALTLVEIFERFMVQKHTEGLAIRTVEEYHQHFGYLLEYLTQDISCEEITSDMFRGYIEWMLHDRGLSPVTVNVRIRTMRALVRFAYGEGYLSTPVHEKVKTLKTEEDTIESLTPAEVKVLLNAIDTSTFAGFRDYVMVCVLFDSMVRISELLTIRRSNVNLKEGTIKLEAHETKTRRARTVPISSKTSKLLADYINESEEFGEELLFLTYDGRTVLANSWRRRLTEYGEIAGIQNKRVSPHTFRHTGALLYILNGGDPFSLQRILGHSDMSMVRKYIQMTNSDVKRQHNSFSPLKNIKV